MATKKLPLVDYEDDSDYASAEDDDFKPDDAPTAAASASEASESEDETPEATETEKKKSAKRKRVRKDDSEEAEDVGFENSGDEAIIGKGLKKAKRRKRRGEEEDEGGEGGFVKTRRMAAMAEEEKAPLATTASSTVDVDAVWASMLAAPITKRASIAAPLPTVDGAPAESAAPVSQTEAAVASTLTKVSNPAADDDTVTIHRTYQFAGKTHTETKIVPRNSAEARLYLAENPDGGAAIPPASPPRRKTKLARRSIFEPVVTIEPRADLKLGVGTIRERLTVVKEDKGKKLNTVEKSKMDWAGYVDQEGLREDLEKAEKDKGSYLQRREFLDRVEGKMEEEARRVRLGGKAKVA